jgi:hypothetical protein
LISGDDPLASESGRFVNRTCLEKSLDAPNVDMQKISKFSRRETASHYTYPQ